MHDGIEPVEVDADGTLVDKMAILCVQFAAEGSYVLDLKQIVGIVIDDSRADRTRIRNIESQS